MEQCNCYKSNRECAKTVENRCSCNRGMMPYPAVMPREETYRYTRGNRRAYECPEIGCDEVGHMPIAMAYVPWQQWGEVFTGECGLDNGTIFPQLVKPWWICCGQR